MQQSFGLFMLKAPVRHLEILALLADGVTVAGSSSMGALRAAELWRYGRRGVGEIFELFRSGVVVGDDEVAAAWRLARRRPVVHSASSFRPAFQ